MSGVPDDAATATLVVGACGGAGASLLAASLAVAWAREGAAAWLVDLDLDRGDLAACWGVVGDRTIADLRPVAAELEPAHVRHAGRAHPSGVTLLPAPGLPGSVAGWGAAATRRLVGAARAAAGAGGRVVVDAGVGLPAEGAVEGASAVLVVCPPALSGARRAAVVLDALRGRGAEARCAVVVGGRSIRGELGARALGRLLGAPIVGELPWSPREADGLASGRWPAGRRARLARAVSAIARAVG